MKRLALIVALVTLVVIVGSCSSTRYIFDSDTQHNFKGYSSYAWFQLASPPDKAQPPTEANTILTTRIRRAIDRELTTMGMKTAPVADADFLVTYSLVLQSQMVMYYTGWSMPMGGWGWGGWGGWGWGRLGRRTRLARDLHRGHHRRRCPRHQDPDPRLARDRGERLHEAQPG